MKPKIKKALKFYFWMMIGIPVSVILCPLFVFCFYIAKMDEFKEDLEYEIELEKFQNEKGRKT